MAENKVLEKNVERALNTIRFLMEHEGTELLKKYNFPVAQSLLATSREEAVQFAKKIGYPVVLKAMSRDIIHKTEAKVVKLNIQNEQELLQQYEQVLRNAKNYNAEAEIAGVLVQEQVKKGLELIFGVKKDPTFGHQLIFGLGGTFVEIMKDISLRMMPVSKSEIDDMIEELKGSKLIEGYRGEKGIERERIYNICFALNELVEEHPEIEELDLNPVMFSENDTKICDVRILLGEKNEQIVKHKNLSNLDFLLNPKSIAVVGASSNETKNGGRLFRYIVENSYNGELYPINPGADTIKGYKAYPTIEKVPNEIELACIIVAAQQVPDVMRQCVAKGVKAAIIYSSGFAEVGEEGMRIQEEVLEIAEQGNILILGPNSIGIASPSKNIYTAFGAALESKIKLPGSIAFISQSGAMGSALLSRSWEQGVGFSRWVSVANEADLSTSDFIHVLADDELTKVITVFMESIKDVNSFKKATQLAFERKKPVLVYKTGKSAIGQRAVQSHTGSIAGDDAVYSAAFDKMNVLRVQNLDELIDVSRAFTVQPLPKGRRIGIVTASGGACSVIADLCAEKGLEVPELTATQEAIKEFIPPFGSTVNPVDVTAEVIAKPSIFQKVVEKVIQDPQIDGVMVMLTTNADPGATIIAQALIDIAKASDKPLIIGRLGANSIAPNAMKLYSEENIPVYSTPERVVSVMDYLVRYSEMQNS